MNLKALKMTEDFEQRFVQILKDHYSADCKRAMIQ